MRQLVFGQTRIRREAPVRFLAVAFFLGFCLSDAVSAPLPARRWPVVFSFWSPAELPPMKDADRVRGFQYSLFYGRAASFDGVSLGCFYHRTMGGFSGIEAITFVSLVDGPFGGYQQAIYARTGSHYRGWQNGWVNRTEGMFCGYQSGVVGQVQGSFWGIQSSGIFGFTMKDFTGWQQGFYNQTGGSLFGVQTGLFNECGAGVVGFQSALVNMTGGYSRMYQSGLINSTSDMSGYQQGLLSISRDVQGVSCALIAVSARNFIGAQLAVLLSDNSTLKGYSSALVNSSRTNRGVQFGVLQVDRLNEGVTVGLFNFTARNDGLSLGLVNLSFADRWETRFSSGSDYWLDGDIRTRGRYCYGILSASFFPVRKAYDPNGCRGGAGMGVRFPIKKWFIEAETLASQSGDSFGNLILHWIGLESADYEAVCKDAGGNTDLDLTIATTQDNEVEYGYYLTWLRNYFRHMSMNAKVRVGYQPLPWLGVYAGATYSRHFFDPLQRGFGFEGGVILTAYDFNADQRD